MVRFLILRSLLVASLGTAVDYLSRFMDGQLLEEAFKISFAWG